MKRIKEFVKKIGNKKYCLLSLLLAGLLIFAVLSGLNGSKSAKTEVNALSAPVEKNLDLNGIRYTYQTSLKELKNDYNFLKYEYRENLFTISEGTETVNYCVGGQYGEDDNSTVQCEKLISLANDNIVFYDLNNKIIDYNLIYDKTIGSPAINEVLGEYSDDFSLSDISKFEINFKNLLIDYPHLDTDYFKIGYNNYNTAGVLFTFVFVNKNVEVGQDKEYYKNNSIFFNYATDINPANLTLKIPHYDGYELRQICCLFANEANASNLDIGAAVPTKYIGINEYTDYFFEYICIDNVKFINDNVNNIISFNSYFDYNNTNYDTLYKGNILLSNDKYDEKLDTYINEFSIPMKTVTQTFNDNVYLGGEFSKNTVKSITYRHFEIFKEFGTMGAFENSTINVTNNNYYFYINKNNNKVVYNKQNQLIYCRGLETLKTNLVPSGSSDPLPGLSAQVEDILYGVEYVGDIKQDEFNKKVEDDFLDLLKLGGFGAIIGLIIGLIAGVPGIGAGVGALIGAAIAVIPLIIDALQAIFGYDFLSGLWEFFNSITEFFVKIVDTIINFLFSIITNPFVLILIAIVVIVYIFVIRKDE